MARGRRRPPGRRQYVNAGKTFDPWRDAGALPIWRACILRCKPVWDSTKRGAITVATSAGKRPTAGARTKTMDDKSGSNLKSGQLTVGGKSWSFPIYEGT